MSLYSLYCVILVHPLTRIFPVDIAENNFTDNENNPGISYENLTFGHLKELICNKKKQYFPDKIFPHELNLWSVEGLSEGNAMWKTLQEKLTLSTEINIKQDFNGNELGTTKKVQDVFPRSGPSDNNVHIIVELSPSPATTGKKRGYGGSDNESEVRIKKKKLSQLKQQDVDKIINLIDNLNTIDTNQQVFSVPPLPGDNEYTTIYNRQCYPYFRCYRVNNWRIIS